MTNAQAWAWTAALTAIFVYSIAQAIRDIRAKRYAWALAGLAAAAILAYAPLPPVSITIYPRIPEKE